MTLDLTIISVSYNSAAIFLTSWKPFLSTTALEVIMVDNASPDGSGPILARSFPNHRVIQADRNLGYGRAANEGIKHCRSRFVLLLNPDLSISEKTVSQLYTAAIKDPDNTAIWAPAITPSDFSSGPPLIRDSVRGAAMLFDLRRMEQVGFFDDNIFLYSEESDLCYRTRMQGFLIKLFPAIFIEHEGDNSSGHNPSIVHMKSWHFGWSRCYYLHKHSLNSAKKNPRRMYRNYRLQSIINMNALKRLRYKGQAAGVNAFIRGEKAFLANGDPQENSA